MHAITGVYAKKIFHEELGASMDNLKNCEPSETFNDGHPDPNLTYAKELVSFCNYHKSLCAVKVIRYINKVMTLRLAMIQALGFKSFGSDDQIRILPTLKSCCCHC